MVDNLETITVEVSKPKSKSFLINTWYRPPDSCLELCNDYEECVKNMDSEGKEIVLIGDFNCDWTPERNKTSLQTSKRIDLANKFQFEQLIKEPTRVTETISTLIDLAFSNRPEIINSSGVEHLGISNHSLIYVCTKISSPRKEPKIINTRQFKNYDKNVFCFDLSKIPQTLSNDVLDPNTLWQEWRTKFLLVADIHAPPIIRKVTSEYALWITNHIKRMVFHRDFLKKKAVKTGSVYIHEAYKRARNDVNKLIKTTKANYFMSTINSTAKNLKEMWKTLNKLTKKKSKTTRITKMVIEDEISKDPESISNTFNKFFNEIGVNLVNGMAESVKKPESYIVSSSSAFEMQNVTETEVFRLLSTIIISPLRHELGNNNSMPWGTNTGY